MPPFLQTVATRFKETAAKFSTAQRTLLVIGVAILALGGFALTSWLSKPTYAPLFSSLSGADASAIVTNLTSSNVQYQLADGGTTILVPKDVVYKTRISLAAAGLPANADQQGYSLLDKMGVTSSEFQQQTTYTRAIEGELAKTIQAMDGVELATVKLAMPKDSVFSDQKATPTASVFLKTRAGANLSGDQVQSIINMVAASVSGMTPSDVAVSDSTGKVLSAVGAGVTSAASQKSSEYETKITAAVQAILDKVVGPGKSVVSVTADLNYDQTQRTTEQYSYTPNTPPLSEKSSTEVYSGSGNSTATGVLGPDNIAVPAPSASAGTGGYTNKGDTVNNSVNKTTEQTTTAQGTVRRQSVAVAVDASAATGISQADLEKIVATAAGIDTARGDTVSVAQTTFDTSAAKAAQDALASAAAQQKADAKAALIRQGEYAGGGLLALLILAFVLWRRSRKRRVALDVDLLKDPADEIEPFDDPEDDEPIVPIPQQSTLQVKRGQIETLAEEQPDEVADLLRGWVGEKDHR